MESAGKRNVHTVRWGRVRGRGSWRAASGAKETEGIEEYGGRKKRGAETKARADKHERGKGEVRIQSEMSEVRHASSRRSEKEKGDGV